MDRYALKEKIMVTGDYILGGIQEVLEAETANTV